MSFTGTAANDQLDAAALAGPGVATTLDGLAGDDTLIGGAAADALFGRGGDDTLRVRLGQGRDLVVGGAGDDTLILRLTAAQAADAAIQAEIAALLEQLAAAPDGMLAAASAQLGLTIRGIETLTIVVDPAPPTSYAPVDLGDIAAGIGGFAIRGEAVGDDAGISAAGVGDVDGDGLADILIGAWFNDAGGAQAGAGYLVRGKADGGLVQLAGSIAGDGGFRITGEAAGNKTGKSVSPTGDVNGDGIADLLIGAPEAGAKNTGASYVVFGGPGLAGPIDLDAVAAGIGGFKMAGESFGDRAGKSNADAGDVNGDGLADLIIGARGDDDAGAQAGAAYVVFGKATGAPVALSAIRAGQGGFKILGEAADDGAGYVVAGLGDVDGDGLSDLLVGANGADGGGPSSGAAYVVFGKTDTDTVDLGAVAAGDGGFRITGEAAGDRLGIFVSRAGDVNGDGLADMIVGANGHDAGGSGAGAAYVVFGKADGAAINLDTVAAGAGGGFKITGAAAGDDAGVAVGDAGDVNGDGLADLLVGARFATTGGVKAGAAYLVFGKADGGAVTLAALGAGGVALIGDADGDKAGVAVHSAGDVNGDGLADILVAADGDNGFQGTTYVVFGRADWLLE